MSNTKSWLIGSGTGRCNNFCFLWFKTDRWWDLLSLILSWPYRPSFFSLFLSLSLIISPSPSLSLSLSLSPLFYISLCIYIYVRINVCALIYIYIYIYIRGSLNEFQTFFVWALLLRVHTWNSSPLWSNLPRLQCTCCTAPTTSGGPHGSPLVCACQWPSSQPLSSPQLSHNDNLWA